MSISISTVGSQLLTTTNLQNEQSVLTQLNEQLASNQKFDNLTQYAPVDAKNLVSFQNAITQRTSFISGMQTVSSRLSIYDSTMTDMESVAQSAESLAGQFQTLDTSSQGQIGAQADAYLQQVQDDLNQEIGGRYVYAGSRYTTPPVSNLTTLGNVTTPFTPSTSPALPDYDANYSTDSFTVNNAPANSGATFTVGNTTIPWSQIAAGNVTSVTVAGSSQAVTVNGLAAGPNLTPTQLASNLQKTITQIATQVPNTSSAATLSATVSGATLSFAFSGSPAAVTPDAGGTAGDVTWVDAGTDPGTTSITMGSSTAAYAQDSVSLDQGYNATYGITSTQPAFQQLIAGLRLIKQASTETDPTAYSTEMKQGQALLATALNGVQTLHAGVAGNINLISSETTSQNTNITDLQNQISNIQSVDVTQIGTEINLLQTQLQASYSASAGLLQDSILKYL